jgi:beta-glucosidase
VHEPDTDLARARAAARDADAVVAVVGLTYQDEGEHIPLPIIRRSERGGDREDLALPPPQRALVEAVAAENPRTIVVLIGGAAITVEGWHDRVAAILMAFYPGEQGGAAIARVLLGAVNPGGRLPFTVPADASHLPPFDNVAEAVDYGPYHGYTLAEKRGHAPRYAFGFGLGYTTFSFANLSLDAATVRPDGAVRASVEVTNTGRREGETVVQLYVGTPASRVERPVKLLRGFERVRLAPGETTRVAIAVKVADLGYYDAAAKQWVVERAPYLVHVGPSSRQADLLTAGFTVVD